MGADAVLLIVALLDHGELAELYEIAGDLGMAALVEVHDEDELERALEIGATLVGVNQRDLHSFEVDRARAEQRGASCPRRRVEDRRVRRGVGRRCGRAGASGVRGRSGR